MRDRSHLGVVVLAYASTLIMLFYLKLEEHSVLSENKGYNSNDNKED